MARGKKNTKDGSGKEFDLAKLAAAVGGEILDRMDTVKSWIDTGNLALNFICSGKFMGGGCPVGKLVEIWGNSSSCKTLFALNIIRGVQKAGGIAVFVDVENTLNAEFAKKAAHIDTSNVLVIPVGKADSLERAFNQIHVVLREIEKVCGPDVPAIVVYDSIAASASEKEYAETTIDMFSTTKAAKKEAGVGSSLGEHARIIGKELRKLNPVLNRANTSVVMINQIRNKIGVLYGSPEKKAAGGCALEFYCSVSIKTKASKKLKDERENIKGILVSVENTKNKCFRPFVEADDMNLFFDVGINPLGGLLSLLYREYRIDIFRKSDKEEEVEVDKKGKKKTKPTGWWKVNEKYSDGQEVIFQATLEKNIVPTDVLLKCPKLIDAENQEQIVRYIAEFGVEGLEVHEKNITEEDITSGEALDMELAG